MILNEINWRIKLHEIEQKLEDYYPFNNLVKMNNRNKNNFANQSYLTYPFKEHIYNTTYLQ